MAEQASARMSNLTLRSPTLLDKKPHGSKGIPIDVVTNVYPLTVADKISYYKYDFRAYLRFKKHGDGEIVSKELSKQTRDDYTEQDRKRGCVQVFTYLTQTESIFQGGLLYDRAALLYSPERLPGISRDEKEFILPATTQNVAPDADSVLVTIKEAGENFLITTSDLRKSVNAEFKRSDKSVLEVLNLATSQYAFFANDFIVYGNGAAYLMDPGKFGFESADAPPIGKDKYTGIGVSKGVKILEGENSSVNHPEYKPFVVTDVKKTAFHYDNQPLSDKIRALYANRLHVPQMTREFKDLQCLTNYRSKGGKRSIVTIGGFTKDPIGQCTFMNREGQRERIVDYYAKKYNCVVKNEDIPGVIDKFTKHVYPAEVLLVAPNQRVKTNQATSEVIEALIKVSATQPEIRLKQTEKLTKALGMSCEAAMQTGIFMAHNATPVNIKARRMPLIKLRGGGSSTMDGPSWRSSREFFIPARLENWAVFLIHSQRSRMPGPNFSMQFVDKMMAKAREKGMRPEAPKINNHVLFDRNGADVVVRCMDMAAKNNCKFVFFISDCKDDHAEIKLQELERGVLTQEMELIKAVKLIEKNQSQTLENILMKTNEKLGGKTHVAAADGTMLHNGETMIIGLTITQPRSLSAKEIETGSRPNMPAVIGISTNNGKIAPAPSDEVRSAAMQQYFTTSWRYANPREWEASKDETQRETLKTAIMDALKTFKANRGFVPMKVVVYRGGVSEGQLAYIAGPERDIFMDAFRTLNEGYTPHLAIIAVSKDHNERFYPKIMPKLSTNPRDRVDQNLPPGVVIDHVVVNPEFNEFYLQSHKALQGTAKATKYFVCHEPGGLSMDMIEHMTNALCHLHSVVNSTTAIPTPLYVAEESAKRGVEQFQHKGESYYELDDLNKNLTIASNHPLHGYRFNA